MSDIENNLSLSGIKKLCNFKFSDYTTYRLGGAAKAAYFPETEAEAAAVFDYLKEAGEKYTVLGKGSNVLVADGFYDGFVICTKFLRGIIKEEHCIYCRAGTTVAELLKFCIKEGIGGLEYLAGIPASIGGLALMNGGILEKHISENVSSVTIYDGKTRELSKEECNFTHKHSIMRDIDCVVLGVKLSFSAVPREAVKEKVQYYLKKRQSQPKGKTCGCVFKNPPDASAGMLIDKAGIKDLKYGGAEVSSQHANFIVNNGAKASDVYNLIAEVKRRVYDFCGVTLEEEVIYIGDFDDFDG